MLLLTFLASGVVFGYLQGGRTNALSLLRLKFGFLILLALSVQATLFSLNLPLSSGRGFLAHISSYLLVIAFLLLNRQVRWVELVSLGLALNLLSIVSSSAYVLSSPVAFAGSFSSEISPAGWASAPLWFLGDILSLPQGFPFGGVFSIGDVIIGSGLFAMSREIVLARVLRPQVANIRYRPRHLAGASWNKI